MRTLASLLATAALVGGVTIASAQSGSPTAPSGPTAGGASPPAATQQGVRGNRGTTGQAKGAGASPTQGSGVPPRRRDQGPGVLARRDVDFPSRIAVHERGRRGALVAGQHRRETPRHAGDEDGIGREGRAIPTGVVRH